MDASSWQPGSHQHLTLLNLRLWWRGSCRHTSIQRSQNKARRDEARRNGEHSCKSGARDILTIRKHSTAWANFAYLWDLCPPIYPSLHKHTNCYVVDYFLFVRLPSACLLRRSAVWFLWLRDGHGAAACLFDLLVLCVVFSVYVSLLGCPCFFNWLFDCLSRRCLFDCQLACVMAYAFDPDSFGRPVHDVPCSSFLLFLSVFISSVPCFILFIALVVYVYLTVGLLAELVGCVFDKFVMCLFGS